MKKREIIEKNRYDFEDWFEKVDPKMQEAMKGFFDKGDGRNKIIDRIIRKEKIKKIGGQSEL
jgi:hypothetical protein